MFQKLALLTADFYLKTFQIATSPHHNTWDKHSRDDLLLYIFFSLLSHYIKYLLQAIFLFYNFFKNKYLYATSTFSQTSSLLKGKRLQAYTQTSPLHSTATERRLADIFSIIIILWQHFLYKNSFHNLNKKCLQGIFILPETMQGLHKLEGEKYYSTETQRDI